MSDLVERLRRRVTYGYMPMAARRALAEAADRIEALEAQLATARREALEEAAKVALNPPPSDLKPGALDTPCAFQRKVIATAIRALGDKPSSP